MIALPTLRQLQFFQALVRRQSFSKAAADCLVSQSTLSTAIKELEGLLGRQLVDRSTRRFSLTPIGKDVADRAAEILGLTEDMRLSIESRRPLEGPLHLGVIPTIAPFLLPQATVGLTALYEDLELYLREDLTASLIERLLDGSLDAALLAFPFVALGIDWVEIAEDPFIFASSSDNLLANRKLVSAKDLKGANLLLLEEGHCLRDHALDACKLRQQDVANSFGATSLFTLTQMVRAGLGATLLPKMAVDAGLAASAGLVTVPFKPPAPIRKIGLAWRKGSGRRDDCELLAAHFREVLDRSSPQPASKTTSPAFRRAGD